MPGESNPAIPRATYRLQFSREFGFAEAAGLSPYLARLGISHVYASPYLMARPGSKHGYDIVAHDRLNPELGDLQSFKEMCAAFKRNGLKQILDFVPNHMGVGGADNPLWLDVLEWGIESRYARWFDIDWEPEHQYLRGKVLVPFLGDQYGIELENGKLILKFDAQAGEFAVWAYDTHKLPICPLHYARILGDDDPALEYLGDDFSALLEWRPQVALRASELKQRLVQIVAHNAGTYRALNASVERLNAHYQSGNPRTELNMLIQQQHWRVSDYRVAGDDINYRRFFNINDLAGIRVELPEVFDHVHRYTLSLMKEGYIDGLRIDHIDGLIDPCSYLKRLRDAQRTAGVPETSYLVAEKILSRDEQLPATWPVHGTTGYDFCNLVLEVLIDPAGESALTQCYAEFTGRATSFAEIVHESKLRIMDNEMASELNVLARDAARVARQNPRTADFTQNVLSHAIREVIACFPIYRTYLDNSNELGDGDVHLIKKAIADARARQREITTAVFDFLELLMCGRLHVQRSGFIRHSVFRCAMKLQQYSGPVMAKGLEDTAFFRFNRFIALNEVGGSPEQFSMGIARFHHETGKRMTSWPHTMLCTATHDTKHGEDARMRLAALAEMADAWRTCVQQWKPLLNHTATTADDLYRLLQLLVSSWPLEFNDAEKRNKDVLAQYSDRLRNVIRKCMREAKLQTSWMTPNHEYEDQVLRTIDTLLGSAASAEFLQSFTCFHSRVAVVSTQKALVQTALRLCMPGVPDTYQGTELWDFNMVDPDNRRSVDFRKREHLLSIIASELQEDREAALRRYMESWQDGRIKLAIIYLLMNLRREEAQLFTDGCYIPLPVEGKQSNVIAFARQHKEKTLLVIAARFFADRAVNTWEDTSIALPETLQQHGWQEVLTGRRVKSDESMLLEKMLDILPVAVLLQR